MDSPRAYWPTWTSSLRKQGLTELAAWFLDAAGPFNVLAAQILYLGQPFLPSSTNDRMRALAYLLEQEDEARAFVAQLKGQPQ
jgi:hypothetical protein